MGNVREEDYMESRKLSEKDIILKQIDKDTEELHSLSKKLDNLEINVFQAIDSINKLDNYWLKLNIYKEEKTHTEFDKDWKKELKKINEKLDKLREAREHNLEKLFDKIKSNNEIPKEKDKKHSNLENLLKQLTESTIEDKLKGHIDNQSQKISDNFQENFKLLNNSINQLSLVKEKDKKIEELIKENTLLHNKNKSLLNSFNKLNSLKEETNLLLKRIKDSETRKSSWGKNVDFKFSSDFPKITREIDDLINKNNNIIYQETLPKKNEEDKKDIHDKSKSGKSTQETKKRDKKKKKKKNK